MIKGFLDSKKFIVIFSLIVVSTVYFLLIFPHGVYNKNEQLAALIVKEDPVQVISLLEAIINEDKQSVIVIMDSFSKPKQAIILYFFEKQYNINLYQLSISSTDKQEMSNLINYIKLDRHK